MFATHSPAHLETVPNPLAPEPFDLLFNGVAALVVALTITALVMLVRQQARFSIWELIAWIVLIIVVPIAGSVLFLASSTAYRRRSREARLKT